MVLDLDLDLEDFAATCMLSTRFGYGRPAFFARRLAVAFCAGVRRLLRWADFGLRLFQGLARLVFFLFLRCEVLMRSSPEGC